MTDQRSAALGRYDVALTAQAIYEEAAESLRVLADLESQGEIPVIEASDFRASIRRIRDLAMRLGAEDHSDG